MKRFNRAGRARSMQVEEAFRSAGHDTIANAILIALIVDNPKNAWLVHEVQKKIAPPRRRRAA